ncbi:MAG: leucine-rich repeat domain-containing protein, partial [Oscillospiraceae bacterium]
MKKRTTKAISVFLVLLMVFSSVPFSGAGLISFAEDEFNEVNNLLLADGRTGIDNRTDSDFGTNTDIGTDTDNSTDTDIGTETDADIIDSGSCGAQGDNVTYILYDNGLLVISGKGAMADYDYWEEDGEKPPYGNYINDVDNTVKNVIIEYGVTSIGFFAFYRLVTLESATIPDSVTSIGRAAFADCSGLTSITIPDNVTSIGESAFEYCSGLTSVTIPDSVTSIGRVAFADCSGLTSITIPDSVTEIGDGAFADCTRLTSVTIPDSVTSIGRAAFADCSGLTSITIPDNVTSIGYEAFYYCTRLTSVTIPKSVIYIGYNAFGNCINLTHIDVDENNQNYSSVDGVLFNKDKTELIQYPAGNSRTSYEVPDCVNSIGDYAFYKCMSLASITIPNGVTSIGESAFEYCSGLTSVTIPDSVTSIGRAAFADCRGLTSITIPDSVTSIGDYAFLRCFGITSITIPDSVISIGYEAFYYCTSLTSVTIPDSVISIGYEAFYYCTGLTHIDVDENNQYYSSTDGVLLNKDKTELIQYPIGNSRTSYKIPNSVTSIDEFAFRGCSYLMSVTIPDGVTIIDCEVFRKCTGLTSITIPNSVIRIGDMAFSGCYNLTDVYYTGSEEQWHDIIIADGNYYLTDANIHYNYIICDHNNKTSHEAVEATCKEDGYTAGVYCEDCEKWISGHEVIKAHHIDNDGDGICDICQKATSDIIAGETKTIDVAAGETVYLMFVPTASGTYTFKSLSDSDTYGYLYDSYKNELTYNDDDDDGNFSITYDLEAGKTYYWGARYYSSDRSGSFTVSLEAINIKSISFTLAEPIVLTEEIDGDWTYDWVWDEETDDEYRVSWFCYDTPSIYRSGNTITVNYSDDRGSVDYNFDYDEWEFVSKDGDYIDSDDINYSSNQSYNNQWTVGGENYLTVSYFNKNCQVPVEIKENPVESISFTPAEPIVLTEEIDGYWTSDWVWNEATEEDIEVSWFCFNTPSIYRSGNIITVNYNDDRGSVEYYYSDEGAFVSRDGDYIDSDDIGYSSNQSYNNQWTVGGENYLTVSYFNKNCQVPVEIKENPVESISFTPAEPIVLIEGIDGYWTYDWVWDEETDYGDEVYWFRYNTSSTHKEGDVLTINYRDDRGSVDYYFDSDEWGFASEDGDYIDPDAINYSSNQSYNNQWTVGGENYYTISYHGKSCQVPVEIKENPVESISFKLSDSFVLYENSFGNYHTGYWIYDPETDDDQYVKETWFEYSTWELINRIVGNVLTVNYNDGRGTVEYICEFDEEAGFRYVSESGEVIEENEVWAWSDQCDGPSYWWKAGADNYMTVSYFNKNCQAPVEIKENPVEAISYQPSNSIVYELNENGYWVENWAYDEENDEYYEDGEWFSYKKPEINREGDILSVTYNDERGTVDYVCHSSKDSYIYVNEQTGDIYYPCVNVTSDQSYENQFKPGINYFTINTANKDYQLPVILRNGTECAHEELSAPVLDNVIEATCTTDGSYDEVVYCSVCDAELSRETKTIEKLGHDFTEKIVDEAHRKTPATCTEKAVYYYDCSRCAEISRTDTYETGEPLGHDMGAWYTTTAPTCTGKGQEKRDCSRCDYSEVRDIAPTNHAGKYTVERTEPTCTESGFEKGVYCPDCKTWLSGHGVIAKFGHKIVTDKAVAPTCTRSGKTEGKHCSVCGYVLVAQTVVPAKGHSFGEWTVETVASCTEKGTEKR